MGWNPQGWDPGGFDPPGWDPPITPPVTVLTRAAFLDRFGRFAKTEAEVVVIRMWPEDGVPLGYTEITIAQFRAMTSTERDAIRNMGSAAGLVPTEGISNA